MQCFLIWRDNERTLGPSGFLDSKRYNHTFNVRGLTVPPPRTGVTTLKKADGDSTDVMGLSRKAEAYEKEFEKRMKIIEVWIFYQWPGCFVCGKIFILILVVLRIICGNTSKRKEKSKEWKGMWLNENELCKGQWKNTKQVYYSSLVL